jgi:hypothetical protein
MTECHRIFTAICGGISEGGGKSKLYIIGHFCSFHCGVLVLNLGPEMRYLGIFSWHSSVLLVDIRIIAHVNSCFCILCNSLIIYQAFYHSTIRS